jgi:hypothetical protein
LSRRPSQLPQKPKKLGWRGQLLAWLDFLFKATGLLAWFVVLVLALLEIKRYYNIDLIPGYNSAVDDVYGAARGTLSEFFDR